MWLFYDTSNRDNRQWRVIISLCQITRRRSRSSLRLRILEERGYEVLLSVDVDTSSLGSQWCEMHLASTSTFVLHFLHQMREKWVWDTNREQSPLNFELWKTLHDKYGIFLRSSSQTIAYLIIKKKKDASVVAVIGTFTDCQVSVARDAIDSEHRRVITKGSSSRCGPLFINVVHYRVPEHSSV